MGNKATSFLENKFYYLYLIGFFLILALPLLNLPPWFSPPDWGKTIVFRIILSLMIFLFIWQILSQKANNNLSVIIQNVLHKKSKVFWGFWLLIALLWVYFLATLFSQDPAFSFWGSPYRSGGFLNFAFYIIFAILAFLILRKSNWQKIWDFSIVIGIFVSVVAIFQQFGLFSKTIIPYEGRMPSTIGGPIFLGLYLLLLLFPALFFGIKEKYLGKKFFYLFSLLLFLYIILITGSRAVYVGLLIGILYFIFFYPKKLISPPHQKFWCGGLLKIFAGVLLFSTIYGIYCVNTAPEKIPQSIQENRIFQAISPRLSIDLAIQDPRFSGWQVSFEAIKEKPILGYGPENFSIGFDKYYDPSLPYIDKDWGSWWDRAHNFIFDIGVTAGIPALLIYLSLFGALFWQLQKLKYNTNAANNSSNTVVYHGIQATFIAYLAANFFSFDVFSTYLISFLIISYSLSLIYQPEKITNLPTSTRNVLVDLTRTFLVKLHKYKNIIVPLLFIGLIWFIWTYNLKPLQINKEIRSAQTQSKIGNYQEALKQLENTLDSHSYLDSYLRLNYVEFISQNLEKTPPAFQGILAEKAINVLKENTEIRPYYTRNWLLLGNYTNVLIEKGEKDLKEEANSYFEKANQLSPKRQEVFIGWIKIDYLTNDYLGAKRKAQECINLNPKLGECWWLMGLTNICLNEVEKAQKNIEMAGQTRYLINSENSLLQLANAYLSIKNYQELVKVYQKLTKINPSNAQYHFYLAIYYKELGALEEAKKEALKTLELMPEAKKQIEEFLKTL